MEIEKVEMPDEVIEAFNKLFIKGMKHYKNVPHAIGYLPDGNQNVAGFIVWNDTDAEFVSKDGYSRQEFYIKQDGEVCIYKDKELRPLNLALRKWENFVNPEPLGSEDDPS